MNSTIKATDLTSGFTVNLYAIGTQYTMVEFIYLTVTLNVVVLAGNDDTVAFPTLVL